MKKVLIVLVACALYATLRYNLFKGVPWSEWPVYVLNKAFALSALLLLLIDAIGRRRGRGEAGANTLVAAWTLMLLHAGLSLAILRPAYYGKYFLAEKLTGPAGWSIMLGVLSAVGLHRYCRLCALGDAEDLLAKVGTIAFLSGVHAALLGYEGWFQPGAWPGRMIPITLISFVVGSMALAAAIGPRRKTPPTEVPRSTATRIR